MTRFVVALRAEAIPLIDHFGLSATGASPRAFPTFTSGSTSLVVSGPGKTRAAAATAYLYATTDNRDPDTWLNVGIAGHRDRAPGNLIRAHKIRDAATGASFYPARVGAFDIETAAVTTVDRTEAEFATDAVYEMEASGFVETALRWSTSELVQCLKVISDNRQTGTASITKQSIIDLVGGRLADIDGLVAHLESLANELPRDSTEALAAYTERWHFTTTEERRLSVVLSRCRAFEYFPEPPTFDALEHAGDVLGALDAELRARALAQDGYP